MFTPNLWFERTHVDQSLEKTDGCNPSHHKSVTLTSIVHPRKLRWKPKNGGLEDDVLFQIGWCAGSMLISGGVTSSNSYHDNLGGLVSVVEFNLDPPPLQWWQICLRSAVAQPPITYTYNSQLHYFKERFDKYERCNIMIHICIVRTTY